MNFPLKAILYRTFIDPLLAGLRNEVLLKINSRDRVLEIACGTGMLAMAMASKASHVTATDLSEENIAAASQSAGKNGIENLDFGVLDASDLSCYSGREFDAAVISMAIHQFDQELAVKILLELKNIASRIIIADYSHHMPRGWGRKLATAIEWLAGGNHYRNFRNYMAAGGIPYFAAKAGIKPVSRSVRGRGIFLVTVCN
ncbi:MAG TPA: class I SAM-dependent methyltransferase [Bacteroidales bacterium]|mgnify:CR=1 FL=1|jgi:SAM-dependent methyltransferase|nr:class I SAM-dependent methyltransferase [Bacteroidales bacterium]